jgi:zinc transporter ZupT
LLALLGGWANNFIDGMTIGVSFGDSPIRGLTIGIAILSQQFPNEVGQWLRTQLCQM